MALRNLHTTKAEYVLEKNGMRRKSDPHKSSCSSGCQSAMGREREGRFDRSLSNLKLRWFE